MVKKRTTDNSMISIVAIVAIVAIVVMITSIGGVKKESSLGLGEQIVGEKKSKSMLPEEVLSKEIMIL